MRPTRCQLRYCRYMGSCHNSIKFLFAPFPAITSVAREDTALLDQMLFELRGSIVVSISACHAEDPGSIPGRGVLHRQHVPWQEDGAGKPTYVRNISFPVSHNHSKHDTHRARSVAVSYKPPMLVTRVRFPACANFQTSSS